MKRQLSLICVALLTAASGGHATAETLVEWSADNAGVSADNINLSSGFWGSGTDGAGFIYNNFNSTNNATDAINQANYGDNDGDPGAGRNNTVTGELNFITQLKGTAAGVSPMDWPDLGGQYRLRQGNTLNPESENRPYTQLYWSNAAVNQSLSVGTDWQFAFSNNINLATVRAAVRDTNGDWFLSSGSWSDIPQNLPDDGAFQLDLGSETWAAYTPATQNADSLALASGPFNATPGVIDAYGFFLEDEEISGGGSIQGRWRIQGFGVNAPVVVIPEPGSLALCGLLSIGLISRRRR